MSFTPPVLTTRLTYQQMLDNLIFIAPGSRIAWAWTMSKGYHEKFHLQRANGYFDSKNTYSKSDLSTYFAANQCGIGRTFDCWLLDSRRHSAATFSEADDIVHAMWASVLTSGAATWPAQPVHGAP